MVLRECIEAKARGGDVRKRRLCFVVWSGRLKVAFAGGLRRLAMAMAMAVFLVAREGLPWATWATAGLIRYMHDAELS